MASDENITTTNDFVAARFAEDTEKISTLIADDMQFEGVRESASGKEDVLAFFRKNKPGGEWQNPTLDGDCVLREGKVKVGFMTVNLSMRLYFNDAGLIARIVMKKK